MNPLMKLFVSGHVGLYRLTGGRIGGSMGNGKVLLLTTTGAKTGKSRTVPVMYFEHGGQRIVIASFGGAPAHPAWFKNLERNPDVSVQAGGRSYQARAEVVTGEERARMWDTVVRTEPRFGEYEKKAVGREIPVVALREK